MIGWNSIRIWEATNIDEYVPLNIPIINAAKNHLNDSGPSANRARSTSRVVTVRLIDLASVSTKLLFTTDL